MGKILLELRVLKKRAFTITFFCPSDRKSIFFGIWKHMFLIFHDDSYRCQQWECMMCPQLPVCVPNDRSGCMKRGSYLSVTKTIAFINTNMHMRYKEPNTDTHTHTRHAWVVWRSLAVFGHDSWALDKSSEHHGFAVSPDFLLFLTQNTRHHLPPLTATCTPPPWTNTHQHAITRTGATK